MAIDRTLTTDCLVNSVRTQDDRHRVILLYPLDGLEQRARRVSYKP